MTAVIIDDEKNNINNLSALITKHCPEVVITGTASDARQGKDIITTQKPEIVFLDIQMPGMNGFELLRSLESYDFDVIFITAYDQYGIQAVKFAAIDYLLKPVNIDELKEAVKKVYARRQYITRDLRLENLLMLLEKSTQKENYKIALPSLKETRFISTQQIVRCESSNNYTTFYLSTQEQIVVSRPIYKYEEMLNEYGFIRCHQTHLVNKNYIKSFVKEDGGYLLLLDGVIVPVSRYKKEYVKKVLKL